ncbi:MAG: hypothetical protein ACFE8J_08815 [Candidatus Heimdallarchaeota archaeon]
MVDKLAQVNMIKERCPHCKAILEIKFKDRSKLIRCICPKCNTEFILKEMTHNQIINQFIKYYQGIKPDVKNMDNSYAKDWINSITGYKGDPNRNLPDLVSLITISQRYDRLKDALENIRQFFVTHITPNWKSWFQFIHTNIIEFSGLSYQMNQQYNNEMADDLKFQTIDEYKQFCTLLDTTESSKCLIMDHIATELIRPNVNIFTLALTDFMYIFIFFEKINVIYRRLFFEIPIKSNPNKECPDKNIFEFDKGGTLENYRKFRHSVAHGQFQIINKMKKQLQFFNFNQKTGVYEVIPDFNALNIEMVILFQIIVLIIQFYQPFWKSRRREELFLPQVI